MRFDACSVCNHPRRREFELEGDAALVGVRDDARRAALTPVAVRVGAPLASLLRHLTLHERAVDAPMLAEARTLAGASAQPRTTVMVILEALRPFPAALAA